jgi:hypothetical protein
MSKEEILEGNFLIAKFMGYDYPDINNQVWLHSLEWHSYHHDWNKLMPVVEKIESIVDSHHGYFGVYISSNNCTIQATNFRPENPMANPPHYFSDWTLETKINSTWQAVVQFIKWYNQHPKQ